MAKKGYKKSNVDPLKIAGIGFVALFVILIASALIFRPPMWDNYIIDLSEEETYFVYAYTDTCPACREIRDDVADFTASNGMDMELIPVDIYGPSVRIPDDMAVPRIYVVHNGEIVRTETGINPVLALFDEVNSNSFSVE